MRFTQNRRAPHVLFKLDKSFIQKNLLFRFKHWKYGWPFSPLADTNRDRAAIRPVSCCTSFTVAELLIARMAAHLSGFASIPLSDKRKPKNFPASTPKIHFSGFSFSLYLAIMVNNSSRSVTCLLFSKDVTTMSSTYACTFLPSIGASTLSISL